jgi:hypothetical protein
MAASFLLASVTTNQGSDQVEPNRLLPAAVTVRSSSPCCARKVTREIYNVCFTLLTNHNNMVFVLYIVKYMFDYVFSKKTICKEIGIPDRDQTLIIVRSQRSDMVGAP